MEAGRDLIRSSSESMRVPELLRDHRRPGLCALLALAVAAFSVTGRDLTFSGAVVHVMIDRGVVADQRSGPPAISNDTGRAALFAGLLASRTGLDYAGRRAGVPGDRIAGAAPSTADVPIAMTEPDSEKRASDILASTARYRLDVQARPTMPIIDIYARAPTTPAAERLAGGAVAGLGDLLRDRARRQGVDPATLPTLRMLGPPRGGPVTAGAAPEIAALTFLVVFGVAWFALSLFARLRGRAPARPEAEAPPARTRADGGGGGRRLEPALASAVALPGPAVLPPAFGPLTLPRSPRLRALARHGGAWPHTPRLLPWALAGFLAILWLVPFNSITLTASLPLDLRFDRIVLPFVVALWVLALAGGGATAPRLRMTPIHVGVGLFVAVAGLSVVLDAGYLDQTLELSLALKKLTLLVAYVSLFVMIASVVRRDEVPAFLSYTLGLAVVCALGTIWEYRFHQNLFYIWSDKLLPSMFHVGTADSTGVDEIGRRVVRGPAQLGLETVAMLSLALPIALVRALQAPGWRGRLWYGLAACVLMAGAIATYRKSAFLAPVAVFAMIAYFRRRDLLRLAPLSVVLLVVIHAASPGALGAIAFQLNGNRLGVATVSDRTADYDAIRPDVWSHLLFGRGYGSYDHTSYRILDNEILDRLVEIGVLGLGAFVLMAGAVILSGRAGIRSRDPVRAQVGLVGACAAAAFLTMAWLFDVLAFPHTPYIFLSLAALAAVAWRSPEEESP